jgi:hypothetical protein
MRGADHGFGHLQTAAMVDANFSNHQGGLVQSNVSMSDFHI